MASILDINLAERKELKTLPPGEYELQVVGADVQDPKTDKARLSVRCEAIGEPEVYDLYYTLWLPNSKDTEKQVNMKLNRLAKFVETLGLNPDVSQIDLEEWIGATFYAVVTEDTLDDGTPVNRVKRVTGSK